MLFPPFAALPGPAAADNASSPMKKSRSSVPLFAAKLPPTPEPPVRYDGLFATAGRPEPEPPAAPIPPFVAIAVGNTKEGESLPAKPVTELRRYPYEGYEHRRNRYLVSRTPYHLEYVS